MFKSFSSVGAATRACCASVFEDERALDPHHPQRSLYLDSAYFNHYFARGLKLERANVLVRLVNLPTQLVSYASDLLYPFNT